MDDRRYFPATLSARHIGYQRDNREYYSPTSNTSSGLLGNSQTGSGESLHHGHMSNSSSHQELDLISHKCSVPWRTEHHERLCYLFISIGISMDIDDANFPGCYRFSGASSSHVMEAGHEINRSSCAVRGHRYMTIQAIDKSFLRSTTWTIGCICSSQNLRKLICRSWLFVTSRLWLVDISYTLYSIFYTWNHGDWKVVVWTFIEIIHIHTTFL